MEQNFVHKEKNRHTVNITVAALKSNIEKEVQATIPREKLRRPINHTPHTKKYVVRYVAIGLLAKVG